MDNYEKWDKEYKSQNLFAFNNNENGLLWLKTRSVSRSKQIQQFVQENGITLISKSIAEKSHELFSLLETIPDAQSRIDKYLKEKSHEWYVMMGIDNDKLKSDLYNIRHYEWGGDQNNSLDKHLISKYVKTICDYSELSRRQAEIAGNAWDYVQASWYNNWTSYLIESIFKRHEKVIPAVGEIKSVDFFINDYPVDLKVTFFPNQYMDEKLKVKLGKKEITWLKQEAKRIGIKTDNAMPTAKQKYILQEKISEAGRMDILNYLNEKRREVIKDAQSNKAELIEWLYANQGEMRFGSENRLFIILTDTTDIGESWKMKRAFSIIEPKVNEYLDNFGADTLKEVNFTFKGKNYKSLSDAIFILKE